MAIAKPESKFETVTVARGTIVTDEGSFTRGQSFKTTAAEAARFREIGAVRPLDYVEPDEVQDGTIRVKSAEGPNVSGVA